MGEAEFREFARVDMQASLVAMALHVMAFSSSIGLLLPVQHVLAIRTRMRALAWFGFALMALAAYVATAIAAWTAHDHLLFWWTGSSSLCHLVGIPGKITPLVGGAIVILFRRTRAPALLRAAALLLISAGLGVVGISSYRWIAFPRPTYEGGFITIHPTPASLAFVLLAGGIMATAGVAMTRVHRPVTG
jgi:hypothetical protein